MSAEMAKENAEKCNNLQYTDDNIRHLSDMEHIRTRPGMYIGRLGDGSQSDDGIYVLLKEIIDNSIDEFKMKAGKLIDVNIENHCSVSVRDYGRGIPQGKMVDAVSVLNTGGKYDSKSFQKSIGLNGVGSKAVNALSTKFEVHSYREGKVRKAIFQKGVLVSDNTEETKENNGTYISFEPDEELFLGYSYHDDIVETMLRNYTYLNVGLCITLNGQRIASRNGLADLLTDTMSVDALYPIVHLRGEDIEIAFTHTNQYGEEYHSFVNGQYTIQGGTHQSAFKEHIAKTIKDFYKKNYEPSDIRNGIVAAIAVNVQEPMFESSTKTRMSSLTMEPNGTLTVNKFVGDFVKTEIDNFLHRNNDIAEVLQKKILVSEKERKSMAGISKEAKERVKRLNVYNDKLHDCRVHYNDAKNKLKEQSSIFITEGKSASGSITKVRDVNTQAVFSLRGKVLNCYGKSKKETYENEELSFLQSALNIDNGIEGLRYNKVIVATDADFDGMHIRLLIITFFLQFYPELIREGHLYVLQTPLFRVRNKRSKIRDKRKLLELGKNGEFVTLYCYSDEERENAIKLLSPDPEITRFKGLGEISPNEFKGFIGSEIRLEQVEISQTDNIQEILRYYMGNNTMERQNFIIENLRIEEDTPLDNI